jgi:lysophospholipase L1-like esterase
LIGDSITHFWGGEPSDKRRNGPKAWAATFGERRVLNLGFGWDRTQNVLWRLDHGEFDGLRPKLVILNIGTNNFSGTPNARANTPDEVAEGIRAICNRVHEKSPDTHLLVMGVLPRGWAASDPFRAPIAALNAILARTVPALPNATFLDIGGHFLNADGSMPHELMPDTVHPSEKGYLIWSKAIIESGLLPPAPVEASATPTRLTLLHPGAKIVFVSDSITDGGRAHTGNDYNHTMGQSCDGVHPRYAGHALMATEWIKTVASLQ